MEKDYLSIKQIVGGSTFNLIEIEIEEGVDADDAIESITKLLYGQEYTYFITEEPKKKGVVISKDAGPIVIDHVMKFG